MVFHYILQLQLLPILIDYEVNRNELRELSPKEKMIRIYCLNAISTIRASLPSSSIRSDDDDNDVDDDTGNQWQGFIER